MTNTNTNTNTTLPVTKEHLKLNNEGTFNSRIIGNS